MQAPANMQEWLEHNREEQQRAWEEQARATEDLSRAAEEAARAAEQAALRMSQEGAEAPAVPPTDTADEMAQTATSVDNTSGKISDRGVDNASDEIRDRGANALDGADIPASTPAPPALTAPPKLELQ